MDDDIGCFDDFLALPQKTTTVPASSKFRPKPHPKTSKLASVTPHTSDTVRVDDRVEGSCALDSCNVTVNSNNDARGNVDDLPPLELRNRPENLVPRDLGNSDERCVGFVQPDCAMDPSAEKQDEEARVLSSSGERTDGNFFSDDARRAGKFQPKSVSHPNKMKKSVSFDLPCSSDSTVTADDHTTGIPKVQLMNDVYIHDNWQNSFPNLDLSDDYQIDDQNPTAEDMPEQLDLQDYSKILSQPSSISGKFQPKHGVKRGDIRNADSSDPIYATEAESFKQHSLCEDTGILDDGALRSFGFNSTNHNDEQEDLQTDDIQYEFDGSNLEQNFEAVSGCDVDEEMQSPNDDALEHQRFKEVPSSKIFEDVGAGRSHMKLRKRVNRQGTLGVEEKNNEDLNGEETNTSRMDEDDTDEEFLVTYLAKKKTQRSSEAARSRPKQTDKQKGKSSKTPEVTEEVQEKKKFPHRTKKKRRQVDKVLLETPEYEINLKQIAMKDLILLGEAKERILNKEASIKGNSSSSKRNREAVHDNYEENPTTESTKYFNYGSYSNRTHVHRWSKSETELLYKAIRQFGTDFAMVQQLFPHRTRHQVKLKFKNEERKNPLLLHDALCHQSNDLSHFKQVIEMLQANKEQTTRQYENDGPYTSVFEDAVGVDEEERVEIRKDDNANENDLDGETKSPGHSGGVEFEAESPTDFDDYESAWD